jgi:predicted methyltransferase
VVEAARHNPESQALFEHPKIDFREEDVLEAIGALDGATFDRVFHDPPRLSLAGELYAGEFYVELFRVLKAGGRLFHYTGAPGEKQGKRVREGVMRRLRDAGFERVRDVPAAQGVSAVRPGPRRG